MTIRAGQVCKLLFRIAVTAGLLTWVFSQASVRAQFWQTVRTARGEFLILVWLLTGLYFLANSFKLQMILDKQACHARVRTIFRASAVASLYGLVLPGILSAATKWYLLEKETRKGGAVLSGMIYNQLSVTVVTMSFGLIGLMIADPTTVILPEAARPWLLPLVSGVLLALTVLISLLLLNGRTGGWMLRAILSWLRPFPAVVRQKATTLFDQIALFQTCEVRFHATMALITIVMSCIFSVVVYVLSACAANVHAPLGVLIWLGAVVYLLGRLPISLANLGVREVTLVGFLTLYGVEESAALLMSMVLFSCQLFMAALGALYQLCGSRAVPNESADGR